MRSSHGGEFDAWPIAGPPRSMAAEAMSPAEWSQIRAALAGDGAVPASWSSLFGPFVSVPATQAFVIGQLGQSLDGRIATPTGESKYINGRAGLSHLHRLRALADAVVIGVGTANADDPRLDVRFVEGRSPARVVIDARGRMRRDLSLLRGDGCRRIIITTASASNDWPDGVELIKIDCPEGRFAPAAIVKALSGRGFKRILIEGGAQTVSSFLAAGQLDRLHVIVAPFIIGGGPAGLSLPSVQNLADGLRPPTAVYPLGGDVLFDCDLSGLGGNATRST